MKENQKANSKCFKILDMGKGTSIKVYFNPDVKGPLCFDTVNARKINQRCNITHWFFKCLITRRI